MEKYFEIGQKVWDVRFGEGVVISVEYSPDYPIEVKFESGYQRYTNDGIWRRGDSYPSLFQTAPIITPNVPIVEFEKGELVWVRHTDDWYVRFFSHSENGKNYCFYVQKNEGDVFCWSETRKFTDNPLLTK